MGAGGYDQGTPHCQLRFQPVINRSQNVASANGGRMARQCALL